mgnify:CR=1 FL=1
MLKRRWHIRVASRERTHDRQLVLSRTASVDVDCREYSYLQIMDPEELEVFMELKDLISEIIKRGSDED